MPNPEHPLPEQRPVTSSDKLGKSSIAKQGIYQSNYLIVIVCSVVCVALVILINQVFKIGYFSADSAYFDYTYKLIAAGYVPYRDFFLIHGPLAYWLCGLLQKCIGSTMGIPVFGVFVYLLLVASAVILGLSASDVADSSHSRTSSRWAVGIFSACIAGGWYRIAWFVPFGGRPKFLAIALLMLAVSAFAKKRSFLAGCLGALACWTWQAAAFQVAGIGIVWLAMAFSSRKLHMWGEIGKLILGGLLVSIVCLIVIFSQGTWNAFIENAVEFPLFYQIHTLEVRSHLPVNGFLRMFVPLGLLWKYVPISFLLIAFTAIIGLLMKMPKWQSFYRCGESPFLARSGIISLLVFGYFQLIFVTHGPGYVVPLLAPLGPLTGWILGSEYIKTKSHSRIALFMAVVLSIIMITHSSVSSYKQTSAYSVQTHMEVAKSLKQIIGKDGTALIIGDPVLKASIGGELIEPDVQWIYGRDRLIESKYEGGIMTYLSELIARKPNVVYISDRAGSIEEDLLQIMGVDYEILPDITWNERAVYVRVDN